MQKLKMTSITLMTLLCSTGTLICCTLPALVSVIAGGAAVVSLVSTAPWLVTISKYHGWIFIVAGIMLVINAYMLYWQRRVCPIEVKQYCERNLKITQIIFWVSVVIYLIGFTMAYILPYLLYYAFL